MIRRYSKYLFTSIVASGFVLILAEGWVLQQSQRSAARALAALKQKKQEGDWLVRQLPALSPENEAAITADVAAAGHLLVELGQALQGKDASLFTAPPPARSIDAFFALANFTEQLRARAVQAQVRLKADERFGFASHAHEAPVAEHLAFVHRQQLATQYLVETLFEAHPLVLVSVQRERPAGEGAREQADDFFALDRALSLRQPGQVESEAFRLEFTGQTAALRNFLNGLAEFRQPVVVRSVEVEPLAVAVVPGSPAPLVTQTLSRFAVTVEFAPRPSTL